MNSFKSCLAFIALIAVTLATMAQNKPLQNDPKILILTPAKTNADPDLLKEVQAQNDTIAKMQAAAKNHHQPIDNEKQPENIRAMQQNMLDIIPKLNFYKQISMIAQNFLVYRFFEKFPNTLILVSDTALSGELAAYKQLSEKQKTDYILDFPELAIHIQNNERVATMKVRLYERTSGTLLIDKVYNGGQNNPGFEFTCKDGTLACTLNNALSGALDDIVKQVAQNNPSIKREKQLQAERTEILLQKYYPGKFDAGFLRQVNDVDTIAGKLSPFQLLISTGRDKFVAFYCENAGPNSLKSLQNNKDKGKVDIITDKDIHDKDYLNKMPETYAYIIKGIKYKNRWYVSKDKVAYFDAENLENGRQNYFTQLQSWGFFKDDQSEFSPDFWEGVLFEKITDKRKDPKWEKYHDMWEMEERENRDYIGLYAMVADKMKEDYKALTKKWELSIANEYLNPVLDAQVKAKANHIVSYNPVLKDQVMIYSKARRIILSPVQVIDEQQTKSIRWFITLPADHKVYEWTRFKPYIMNNGFADDGIVPTLSKITKWDFSYTTLDDENFWKNEVLLKEGTHYKYLKAL